MRGFPNTASDLVAECFYLFITFDRISVIMIRTGQKLLSVFLLLPIITILAHNAIPHHHHVSPVEICCADQQNQGAGGHLLDTAGHIPAGQHDACCFNPEFTFDLYKILLTASESDHFQIVCPLKSVEPDYRDWFADKSDNRIYSTPNFLRGPPAVA
jgi:hypothetical protein